MFLGYVFIGLFALVLVSLVIGLKKVLDPRRLIGWYLVVFAATYFIRPMPAAVHDLSPVYDVLEIVGFSAVPLQMTAAVVASLLFLAIGYRLAERRLPEGPAPEPAVVKRRRLIVLSLILIVWAYTSAVLFPASGAVENLADRQYGVNTGTTAWLTDSVQFASTGTTALYILTGKLTLSLVLAIPWFLIRVSMGWSRVVLIAYFVALLCVAFVQWRQRWSFKSALQAGLVVSGVLFAILVFLPAAGNLRSEGGNFLDLSRTELVDTFLKNFDPSNVSETGKDVSGFEPTVYMIETKQPPRFGMYYAYFYFIKPIPRTLWTGKPLPPDLAEWLTGIPEDTKFFGLAAGSIGDALFAWGWLGIPLEFMLTGWVFRRLEFRNVDRHPSPPALLAYAGFFSLLPQLGRDSLIHMISERWLFVYGIPCLLMWYLNRQTLTVRSRQAIPVNTTPTVRRLVGHP